MVGDKSVLVAGISAAFDVEHGETSSREQIANDIADAIIAWAETVKTVTPSCNYSGVGSHPEGKLE